MTQGAPDDEDARAPRYRQFVPRPATAAEGGPAPWADLPPGERRPISLERVAAALVGKLAPAWSEPSERAHAAVLVPIFEREGEATVVLIRRGFMLASNPGDLAFPGGRLERGERAVDAAVRESEEEVDLRPDEVKILGRMAGVSRARASGWVAPFVGLLDAEPHLRPDPVEVDEVLTVSLADLAEDGTFWEEIWNIGGMGPRRMSFFSHASALGADVLWGMTAGIVRELLTDVLLGEATADAMNSEFAPLLP